MSIHMKELIMTVISCMLISCSTHMSSERYFCKLSTKQIKDVPLESFEYKTYYIDDDCISCGTFSEPQFELNLKYDTLSRYRVIACGNIFFDESKNADSCEKIDSVELSYVIIRGGSNVSPIRLSNNKNKSEMLGQQIEKNWNDNPLPSHVMKAIRNDFFTRMKYRKYKLNLNEIRTGGISVSYIYQLY